MPDDAVIAFGLLGLIFGTLAAVILEVLGRRARRSSVR